MGDIIGNVSNCGQIQNLTLCLLTYHVVISSCVNWRIKCSNCDLVTAIILIKIHTLQNLSIG